MRDLKLPFLVDITKVKRCKKGLEPIMGIYKITSPSGKIYIGQSTNIENRFAKHYKRNKCVNQRFLHHSFNKYGVENHIFEIVHLCEDVLHLNEFEKYYSDLYDTFDSDNGLNLISCGNAKTKFSDETKKKMSASQKGKKWSDDSKLKLSISLKEYYKTNTPSNLGNKHTDETKKKMKDSHKKGEDHHNFGKSELFIGEKNPFYGKKHKPETIEFFKKRIMSEESKKKNSISSTGKKHTDETKKLMSEKRLGRKESEETRKKKSDSMKGKFDGEKHPQYGKPRTEEAKKNIGLGNKGKIMPPRTEEQNRKTSESLKETWKFRKENTDPSLWSGKKASPETKRKMSEAGKGKKRTPEAIAKTAIGNTGKKRTEESKQKMRDSQAKRWALKKQDKDNNNKNE